MIDYATTVVSIFLATLIPTYAALYLVSGLKRIPSRYLAAGAAGITLWFFYDTMGDAVSLHADDAPTLISQGMGYILFAIVIAAIAGIATSAIFDHFAVRPRAQATQSSPSPIGVGSRTIYLIPVAIAAVMGIHSLGEGWGFASTAASASSGSLVDTFGTLAALISYPIHKFLEAVIFAAVYTIYIGRSNVVARRNWHIPVLGIFFWLPSVIGASLGYYISTDTSYLYAFGVTSAFYAMLRLIEPISDKFTSGGGTPSFLGTRLFLGMTIGFLALYGAALLH